MSHHRDNQSAKFTDTPSFSSSSSFSSGPSPPPRPRHVASAPAPVLGFHRHHHAHLTLDVASAALVPSPPVVTVTPSTTLGLSRRWAHTPAHTHLHGASPRSPTISTMTPAAHPSPPPRHHSRSTTFMSPLSVSRARSWIVPQVSSSVRHSHRHSLQLVPTGSVAQVSLPLSASTDNDPHPVGLETTQLDSRSRTQSQSQFDTVFNVHPTSSYDCSIGPLVSSIALSAASRFLGPVSHAIASLSTLIPLTAASLDSHTHLQDSHPSHLDLMATATLSIRTTLMRAMYLALLVLDDAGSAISYHTLARIATNGAVNNDGTGLDEPPTLTEFDLCELMVVLVDLVHLYAATHHASSVTLLCTAPAMSVVGDQANLRQLVLAVLLTLLDASPNNTSISIALHTSASPTQGPSPLVASHVRHAAAVLSMQVKLPASAPSDTVDWPRVERQLHLLGRPDLESIVVGDAHVALVVEFGLPVTALVPRPQSPLAPWPVPESPTPAAAAAVDHNDNNDPLGDLQSPISPVPPPPSPAADQHPLDSEPMLVDAFFHLLQVPTSPVDPHPVLGLVAASSGPVVPVTMGAWEVAWGRVPVAHAPSVVDLHSARVQKCRLVVVERGRHMAVVQWLVAQRVAAVATAAMGVLVACVNIEDARQVVVELATPQVARLPVLQEAAEARVIIHVMPAAVAHGDQVEVPASKTMYHLLALHQAVVACDEMTVALGEDYDNDDEYSSAQEDAGPASVPAVPQPAVSAHFLSSAATAMSLPCTHPTSPTMPMATTKSAAFPKSFPPTGSPRQTHLDRGGASSSLDLVAYAHDAKLLQTPTSSQAASGWPKLTELPRRLTSTERIATTHDAKSLWGASQTPMLLPPPPRGLKRLASTLGNRLVAAGPPPPSPPTSCARPAPHDTGHRAQASSSSSPRSAAHTHPPAGAGPGARVADQPSDFAVITTHVRVLIVEDNPINLRILSAFLSKRNIQWAAAKDGAEAVRKFASCPPGTGLEFHLVLMDLQLPVMDGLEATRRIRQVEDAWPPAALLAQAQQQLLRSVTPELVVDEGGLLHSVCAQTGALADKDRARREETAEREHVQVIGGVVVGPSVEALIDRVREKRAALRQEGSKDPPVQDPRSVPSSSGSQKKHGETASGVHPLSLASNTAVSAGDPVATGNTYGLELMPSTNICVPTLAGQSVLESSGGTGSRSRVSSDPLANATTVTTVSPAARGYGLLLTGLECRYVPGMQPPKAAVVGGSQAPASQETAQEETDHGKHLARRRSTQGPPKAEVGASRSRSGSAEDQTRKMRREKSCIDTISGVSVSPPPPAAPWSSITLESGSGSSTTSKVVPQSTATAPAPVTGMPSAHQTIAPYHADLAPSFRSIVVALTASNSNEDRKAALAAGCNDFISKPINLRWLQAKIMEWGSIQALIRCFGDDEHTVGGEAKKVTLANDSNTDSPVIVNVPGLGASVRKMAKGGGTQAGGNVGPGLAL